MKASLKFESVNVREAPGIFGGLEELGDLVAGVNVIHGPNASGKSTTLRLMQAVLSSSTSGKEGSRSEADWCEANVALGEVSHRLVVRGKAPAKSDPPFPEVDRDLVDLCRVSLRELLEASERDRFGEALEEAAAGGVNLVRIAREQGLENRKTPRPKDLAGLKAAHRELEAATKVSASHEQQEKELEVCLAERETVSARLRRSQLLKSALGHREHLEQARLAEERFLAFPKVLAKLDGKECDRVRSLEQSIAAARDQLKRAEEAKAAAETVLRDSPLRQSLEKGWLTELENHGAALERLETQLSSERRNYGIANEEMAHARGFIGEVVTDEHLAAVSPATLLKLEEWCDRIEELQGREAALNELRGQLGDLSEPPRSRTSEAMGLLWQWQAASRLDERTKQSRLWLLAGSIFFLLAGVGLGYFFDDWFYGICGGALIFGVAWWLMNAERATGLERQFDQSGFDLPGAWDVASVETLMTELEGSLEDELERRRRSHAWKSPLASRSAELENEWDRLSEEQERLLTELGFVPVLGEKSFSLLAKRLVDWDRSYRSWREARGALKRLLGEIEEVRQSVRAALADYRVEGIDEDFSFAQLKGWGANLREWDERYGEASRNRDVAQREMEQAKGLIDGLKEEIGDIYATGNVEGGDWDSLQELVSQVDDYRDARSQFEGYGVVVRDGQEWFDRHPEFKDVEIGLIEKERLELGNPEEELSEISQRIGALERDLEQARSATEVEEKRLAFEEGREEMHAQREERLEQAAGWLLAKQVHEKVASETVPEVQQRAGELLSRFTDGRCRIEVQQGELMAIQPEISSRPLALEQLSDGTRVQLFVAMRLAFIERQEGPFQLPLFLDEAFANSDDRRAPALMETLGGVAKDGRQILYFTSQGDEAAKWKESLAASGISLAVIPIRKEFGLSDVTASLAPRSEVLAPEKGESVADFRARLGFPGKVDPWVESADQVLLAHVLEDPEDLARFRAIGVTAWGALSGVGARGADLSGGEDSYERSAMRVRLILEVARIWRTGRGRPLERSDLEAGGVKNTATNDRLEQAWEIAERVGRDADRLCEVLERKEERVDGLGPGGIAKLRNYCEEYGFIVDEEPLSDGEIRLRVLEFARTHEMTEEMVEEVLELFSA